MPIIREFYDVGDFTIEEVTSYGQKIVYHFFVNKAVLIVIDTSDDETSYVPLREHDTHGLMSWVSHEQCWMALTDNIQEKYQGWKAEQELLK